MPTIADVGFADAEIQQQCYQRLEHGCQRDGFNRSMRRVGTAHQSRQSADEGGPCPPYEVFGYLGSYISL